MSKKLHCIICGKDFYGNQALTENLDSVPEFSGTDAICAKCTGDGWRFCDECDNPYNKNTINYSDFYIYNNVSDAPEKFLVLLNDCISRSIESYKYLKSRYCCNNHYNLSFWRNEVKAEINILLQKKISRVGKLMISSCSHGSLEQPTHEETDELCKYIDNKIEYIKNTFLFS
ncbi:hypothetical protein ACJDU8_19910 [Clostridium sp. WILCCON 0269]|uniref:Uncharacterized protein n=1 Tax=Candidatus Clostridium eludens TaxID=3381663 RepID=A0ABW8SRM1_9CLOT